MGPDILILSVMCVQLALSVCQMGDILTCYIIKYVPPFCDFSIFIPSKQFEKKIFIMYYLMVNNILITHNLMLSLPYLFLV